MTAIAALIENGKIWMGADSCGVSDDYSLSLRKDEKIFTRDDFLIGGCGSFRMIGLLRYSLRLPKHKSVEDAEYMNTLFIDSVRDCLKIGGHMGFRDSKENGGTFIVGWHGILYQIEEDFQVSIVADNFSAIGCAKDLCLGSLYSTQGQDPEQRIKTALHASERFSAAVRGPFVIKCL